MHHISQFFFFPNFMKGETSSGSLFYFMKQSKNRLKFLKSQLSFQAESRTQTTHLIRCASKESELTAHVAALSLLKDRSCF